MAERDVTARLRVEMDQFERGFDQGAKTVERFSKTVQKAADQVEKAQQRQTGAANRLREAEQRLAELRQKGNASAAQLTAAENRVSAARQNSAEATLGVAKAEYELDKVSSEASTATGRLAQSARENSAEWRNAGKALVVAGAAITGVGAAALKTGIEYNTLQQTTRAALTPLLGSSKAAADQMDRLDDFARNSPFSKATFIQAQQQMLAFGVETRKVIPYLDAVQNAVAAASGSNDDIAGIVATMSKIQSSSKITAEDLNEFGNRGVNAAELIGSQMGKTGAQIRQDITSGSLDAEEALDALAAGMTERFDGTADNVKNTFAGAMDRVKAAWRDLSSALAEPFVGKEGGGIFTGLLNEAADIMRTFESMPGPVKAAAAAVTILGGAAALLGGSLILLAPRIAETKKQLQYLRSNAPATASAIDKATVAVKAFGVALAALAIYQTAKSLIPESAITSSRELEAALTTAGRGGKNALADLDKAFASSNHWSAILLASNAEVRGLDDAMKALSTNPVAKFFDDLGGLFVFDTRADLATKSFEQVDQSLAAMVESGNLAEAERIYEKLSDAAQRNGVSQEKLNKTLPQYSAALEIANEGMSKSEIAARDLATEIENQTKAWRDNATAAMGQRGAAIAASQALADAQALVAKGTRVVHDNTDAIDLNAESSRDAESALIDLAGRYIENAEAIAASGASAAELDAALESQRESFIATARQMGYTQEEAQALADKYGQIPRSIQTDAELKKAATWDGTYAEITSKLNSITGTRTFTSLLNFATGSKPTLTDLLMPQARGGLVEYFTSGGFREHHIAQFAPAGSWRVFGEPETGGEAYIPLAQEKRSRSIDIWQETGRRLGVVSDDNPWSQAFEAAAATYSSPQARTGPVTLVQPTASTAADSGIDPTVLAGAVRTATEAGVIAGFARFGVTPGDSLRIQIER